MVMQVLSEEGLSGRELDLIAVSRGPGSFTGIRIGMATAKALARVWDKPIVAVPTLESFAYRDTVRACTAHEACGAPRPKTDPQSGQACDIHDIIVPIFDARRDQVYAGIYQNRRALLEGGAYGIDEFKERLFNILSDRLGRGGCGEEAFSASELLPYAERSLRVRYFGDGCYLIGRQSEGEQEALQLLELAEILYNEGKYDSCFTAEPEYMRMAEAERKLREREIYA